MMKRKEKKTFIKKTRKKTDDKLKRYDIKWWKKNIETEKTERLIKQKSPKDMIGSRDKKIDMIKRGEEEVLS